MAFRRDYEFGLACQSKLLSIFEEYFKDDLKETPGKFAPYDYEGTTASYELKSRNNTYKKYPTTCIGADKIKQDHPKAQVFLFHFTDGDYYIRYNKTLFDTFETKLFRRFRSGHNDPEKLYTYIPIECLTKIESSLTV
jgi:hypothetical protein